MIFLERSKDDQMGKIILFHLSKCLNVLVSRRNWDFFFRKNYFCVSRNPSSWQEDFFLRFFFLLSVLMWSHAARRHRFSIVDDVWEIRKNILEIFLFLSLLSNTKLELKILMIFFPSPTSSSRTNTEKFKNSSLWLTLLIHFPKCWWRWMSIDDQTRSKKWTI